MKHWLDSHSIADLLVLRLSIPRPVVFTEIAIDSMQRYLIVPFVLIGPMPRCPDSWSIHPDDVQAALWVQILSVLSSWPTSVFFSFSFSLSPALSPCFCRLSSSLSAVHCDDWRVDVAARGNPRNLRFFFTKVDDAVTPKTNNGRRGHGIEAGDVRVSTATDWRPARPGPARPPSTPLRVMLDRWRRMWWFSRHTSKIVNLSGRRDTRPAATQSVTAERILSHKTSDDVFDRCVYSKDNERISQWNR